MTIFDQQYYSCSKVYEIGVFWELQLNGRCNKFRHLSGLFESYLGTGGAGRTGAKHAGFIRGLLVKI